MRTIETAVYTAKELQEKFPKAFEKARREEAEFRSETDSQEIANSLKGLIEAIGGVKIKDWGFSSYGRDNHCRVEFSQDEAGDLSGKRAFSWFESNLFRYLRVKPGIRTDKKDAFERHFVDYGEGYKYGKRYARYHSVGEVPECPFTGHCFDADLLDYIRKGIRSGDTVREILEGLADECGDILEKCEEGYTEESFIETADANGWEFHEDGTIA